MKGKLKNSKGITLVALVITIVIIIILSTIAYNFTFGENGLITRAQQAAEMSEVSRILEQLEMAKGSAYIDGQGEIDPDHYFDILEEEEIINDKETDVVDNGDGTYDVTTEGDRVFEITLTPDGDLDIEYVGNNDEPRISGINVTEKTDSSISVEVITKNVDGGEYTYSYKKTEEGEETWQEAGSSSDSTFTFSGLDNNTSYDIKVTVTTGDTTIEKTITVQLGTEIVEVPDGTISFGEVVWQGDGTASMTVTTSEPDFTLQYQVGGTDGQWTTITSGQSITGLKHGDTVYTRLTDGTDTNTSEIQETTIEDTTPPTINVTLGTSTSSSIAVNVEATDAESGMAGSLTYTYYIKQNGQDDSSYTIPGDASNISSNTYTFAGLTQGIGYDIKVEVKSDAAGNTGVGTLTNQITTSIPGGDTALEDGTITIGEPTWSGGKASIEVSTKSMYTLEYQINGTDDNSWTPVSGDTISNLSHGDKVNIRLTDGVNAGGYVTKEIKDEILPIVSVTPQGTTSNSVSVNVIATDAESGMVASPTYTYYIKKTSEEDTAYAEKATGITESAYTFTSLEQGTSYDVKVEVTGDVAGNTGSGTLTNQTTERIPAGEDDIVEGAITFGQVSWNAGVASITIDTSTNYTIEYQVGSIEGSWTEIEKGGIIPNLKYGDTVYARLTDGYNHGDYATANISDTIPPTITEVSSSKTTNSVTLEVTSTDNESGMPDTINYKFEIKQSNEPDSSYQEIQTGTNTTATKDGLAQGTRYTVRVTTVDNAGNTGTLTKDIITDRVSGATSGLKEGNLIASEPEWADGSASITLSTTTGYQIQWQKVSQGQMMGDSWNDYDGAITELKHGDMVYARLWDGQNAGQEASVTIEDKIQPQSADIQLSGTSTGTEGSVTATVTLKDNESGIDVEGSKWIYNTTAGNIGTDESSYTNNFTTNPEELTLSATEPGTYYLHVLTKDAAGNKVETISEAITVEVPPPSAAEALTAGDWVRYEDGTGVERECVVLYDSTSEYGVEIITMETVEDVELGNGTGSLQDNNTTYFNTAKNSYNNAISTLNNATSKYLNTTYADSVRSVGSDPSNPTSDNPGYFTSSYSYMSSYNGQFKNQDTHYETDYNQMGTLTIRDIDKYYWLASRHVFSRSSSSAFYVRYVSSSGNLYAIDLCYVYSSGNARSFSNTYGLRPVFHLRDTVTVTGGSGTEEDPYTLYAPPPPSIDEIKPNPDEAGEKVEENTTILDDLDNKVVIPGGFHLAADSGTSVEEGIVIEDDSGNQFVWVPVGVVTKNDGSKSNEIKLGRYTFDRTNGTPTEQQLAYTDDNPTNYLNVVEIDSRYQELSEARDGVASDGTDGLNATAKDLAGFVQSVKDNGGYYIARYEASYGSGSSISDYKPLSKVSKSIRTNYGTELTEGMLWNFITQLDAAQVARNMYAENKDINGNNVGVESDLANSYAWDTAIVYVQEMGHANYANASRDTTGNTNLLNTGETGDVVCNIYDMAANTEEWTTEYSTYKYSTFVADCVSPRGGSYVAWYGSTRNYTAYRVNLAGGSGAGYYTAFTSRSENSFRTILYVKDSSSTTPTTPVFNLEVEEGTQKDTLVVTVQNDKGVQKIELVTQEETREYSGSKNVTERFDILENGDYTVRVTYGDGSTEEKTISITNLNFNPIAKIGSTEYDSLTKAVAAVPAGTKTTIEIIKDFDQSLPVYIPSNKDVVLDLHGYTVTLTTGYLSNLGTLEIVSNGDANGELISQHTEKVCIANNGTTIITSGKLSAPNTNAIRNNENGVLTIAGGTIAGQGENLPTIINYNNSTININGGTITAEKSNAIYNKELTNMTMTNGTLESTGGNTIHNDANSTINITGGSITGSGANNPVIYNEEGNITIANAQVTGTNTAAIYNIAGTITANSGTYTTTGDGSTGAATFFNESNGTMNINNVTATSETSTIINRGAGEIVIDGATINIQNAGNPTITNEAGGSIRIVSGTISSNANNVLYNNSTGSITVQGGEITGSGPSMPTIWNNTGGTINIENGTIKAVQNDTANIYNAGVLNVTGGIIEGDGSSAIQNAGAGSATITNGTITAKDSTVISHNSTGELNIQGGTFTQTGNVGTIVANVGTGNVTISNGTFTTEQGRPVSNNSSGTITISGGNISTTSDGQPAVWNDADGALIITGGTISSNVNTIYNNGTGPITIGVDDGNVSTTSPDITAPNNYYTVYSDTLNFYDGILRGGGIYDQAVVTTPAGKNVVKDTSGDVYYTVLN